MQYKVVWDNIVEGSSPLDAVMQAMEDITDPQSSCLTFVVEDEEENLFSVDLLENEDGDKILEITKNYEPLIEKRI